MKIIWYRPIGCIHCANTYMHMLMIATAPSRTFLGHFNVCKYNIMC